MDWTCCHCEDGEHPTNVVGGIVGPNEVANTHTHHVHFLNREGEATVSGRPATADGLKIRLHDGVELMAELDTARAKGAVLSLHTACINILLDHSFKASSPF